MRLLGPDGTGADAIVDRPFALIGRSSKVDLTIPSPDASLRHVYFHLDRRGVFAIDLASRSGTRFDGAPADSRTAWLQPGHGLELAGYRVEVLEAVAGAGGESPAPATSPASGAPPHADPLAEAADLALMELVPGEDAGRPLRLLSELSFLGRGRHCSVRAEGDGVARVHAVIVRSAEGAFIIDLAGHGLMINGQRPTPASPLRDGDRVDLGRLRAVVRLVPLPRGPAPGLLPVPIPTESAVTWVVPAAPLELAGPLMAQALRYVRDGQDELLRSNDQFQQALAAAIRQIYLEQASLFERHLERLDRLQQEVAELRGELRRRLGPDLLPVRFSGSSTFDAPAPPPLDAPPHCPALEPGHATSWLLDRVRELEGQVEQETRSGWRSLIARLTPPLRARGDV